LRHREWYFFCFEPIRDSRNKPYGFTVESTFDAAATSPSATRERPAQEINLTDAQVAPTILAFRIYVMEQFR
jgi:hypothetical protein